MRKRFVLFLVLCTLGTWTFAFAQQVEGSNERFINVTSTGKVVAKPDLAIVSFSVRSSAPLAADALEQNRKRVQEIRARLAAIGYKDEQVKLSGDRFSSQDSRVFYQGGQPSAGFSVYNNIHIYLEGADLKDSNQFNAKVGSLLDELSKLGASTSGTSNSPCMSSVSPVSFTVRDAGPFEASAYMQGLERTHRIAEDIARGMKVQITGTHSVSSLRSGFVGCNLREPDDLPFEYLSPSISEVPIQVQVIVQYAYK